MDKFDAVEITKHLISYPSVTPEDCGVQVYIASLLTEMGFECHHLPFAEVNNLFARLGEGGPHLCYAGHTDVVPTGPREQWTNDPFDPVIKDGILYGRGASDMKGSVAAFIAAVKQFLDTHGPFTNGSISLLITGDEEGPAKNGTLKVIEWMQANGHMPDVALVGEPTNPDHMGQEIKIGRRGSFTATVALAGKQGHVAYPHLADNPLTKLAHVMRVLKEHVFDEGNEFFPPTNLEFTHVQCEDSGVNVIPDAAHVRFNIRFNNNWSGSTLEKQIRALLDQTGYAYNLACRYGAEAFITKPNEWTDLVRDAVNEVTGKSPVFTTGGGTSDARFIAPHIPTVEYGAINKTIHQIDENAGVSDIKELTKTYAAILKRYFA